MFRIIIVFALILAASISFAVTERQGDGMLLTRDVPFQGFSPNGNYNAYVTSYNSTFHDLRNFGAYAFYCASDCYMRQTATAAKANTLVLFPSGTWYVFVKNTKTPFVNISGAHYWMQH